MKNKIKAFVVDDDEVFGSMICKMLAKLDVEAQYYSNPSVALDNVEKLDPEIIFLDFKMPEMNGDTFMIKYSERTLFSGRRVILVTSLSEVKENQPMYQSLGIENILQKPVSYADMEEIISSHKKKMSLKHLDSKHIAVVDDDELSAKVLIKNLERDGLKCSYFNSGESFLASLRNNRPDVILLDILMPGLSGTGVLKNVRERHKSVELPIIMLTAEDEASDIVEALNSGANDYITKPANPSVALARVKTQLELKDYYKDSLKKMKLEKLNAMIVTYNHEINNPLGIALLNLKEEFFQMTEENHKKLKEAMNRIASITKSIREMAHTGPDYDDYAGEERMIKLKKDA